MMLRKRNPGFNLVTLSNAIQVYPDPVVRQKFLEHVGADSIFYPNLRLKALAEREQIDFLDLAGPMQAYADQNKVFLHGFGSDIGKRALECERTSVGCGADCAEVLR